MQSLQISLQMHYTLTTALAPGSDAAETQIKEETSATLRCIPFDQPGGSGACLFSGEPATEVAVFAKSY